MGIKIEQYRKQNSFSYITKQNILEEPYQEGSKIAFKFSTFLNISKPYYFKIKIKKQNSTQSITVMLQQTIENSSSNVQKIGGYKVAKQSTNDEYVIYENILKPTLSSYNYIVCSSDSTLSTSDIEIEIYEIYNVLNALSISTLNKIGVQAKPGQLMCINGQPIRVNKSGLYELNNIDINFIGFIPTENNFILDYQY